MNLEACFSAVSALAAFVSAVLWVVAARARVTYEPKLDQNGFYPAGISDGGDDFIKTVKVQSKWNRWAAYAAAGAAGMQGISLLLSVLKNWTSC